MHCASLSMLSLFFYPSFFWLLACAFLNDVQNVVIVSTSRVILPYDKALVVFLMCKLFWTKMSAKSLHVKCNIDHFNISINVSYGVLTIFKTTEKYLTV